MKKTRFIITLAVAMLMCIISASALELDAAESAYEMSIAEENAILAAEVDIPLYDVNYGELVWYNNFEESLTVPTYCAGTSGSGSNGGYGESTLVESPTGNGNAVRVNSTSAWNSGYVVKIGGYDKTSITVTLVADYYLPSDGIISTNVWYRFSGMDGKWGLLGNSADKDVWKTVSYTQAVTGPLTNCEFRNDAGPGGLYYLDNVRVYVKYALDASTIRLVDGNDVNTVTIGDTYTFEKSADASAYYTVWVSEEGDRYAAGETVSASAIGGKTFNALKTKISLVDEEKGALILFHGYEGADYKTIEYYDTEYMSSVVWTKGTGISFNSFAHVTDAKDSSNKVLEMTLKDGASYKISGFQYSFEGLEFMPGTFTQVLDVYNRNEGTSLNRENQYKTDNAALGSYSRWKDITFTPDTWVKNLEMEKMYVAKNTDSGTKDTYKYMFGYDLTQGHTRMYGNSLAYLQYRFVDSGKTSVTVDNYRLYFYPANAFMVKDGEKLVMEKADGTYTFKNPAELFGGEYAVNACYTDGESTYLAGQTVEISKIAGKTLTVSYSAPENSGNAEIKVSGVARNNGIRFKASITPSLKAEVNEYGFIIAREDVLNSQGKDLTFDLGGEGSVYVKGAAYKLDENGEVLVDKVYSDNEDGSMNYTAVGVGFDLTSKFQVTTNLVARPYAVFADAEGNDFVVYGVTYTDSLAGVAQDLKAAAESGDEDAVNAYVSANYNGGNYIDDILATANS